jgi:catechol 2,3-dioxygenase-like lactoylglutathione lyase family enzyme
MLPGIKRLPSLLIGTLLCLALWSTPAFSAHVEAIGLTVSDMDRALSFYTQVLTFHVVSDETVTGPAYEQLDGVFGLRKRVVTLGLGEERLVLTEYRTPKGQPIPSDSRSQDHWFQHIAIVTPCMPQAFAWLEQHHVQPVSTLPQRLPDWNKQAGGIEAYYFQDPDHHNLEVIFFPPGKGAPRWQVAASSPETLFLGIDHTAIVVQDTARSMAYYQQHGFQVAGQSHNYGTEQAHLNQVEGAELLITGLRSEGGPGVELLEYRTPTDGRKPVRAIQSNDIAHWEVILVSPDASRWAEAEKRALVTLPDSPRQAVLLHDPDGHVLKVVSP